MIRALGWIPDDRDDRDKVLGAVELPSYGAMDRPVVRDDLLPVVFDQGGDPTCVAEAGAAVIHGAHVANPAVAPPYEPISRLAAHYYARFEDHSQGRRVGSRNRTFFRVCRARGFMRERHWNRGHDMLDEPSVMAQRHMLDQRRRVEAGDENGLWYERISETGKAMLYALRATLEAGMLITAGFDVGAAFRAYRAGEVLDPPSTAETTEGHAMTIYGYDQYKGAWIWLMRNSHGPGYGDSGNLMASSATILGCRDRWTARYAPAFSDTAVAL